ncbi:MAG: hypothetical protein ACXVOI_10875, partial [Tumebacillaceae bacterium]
MKLRFLHLLAVLLFMSVCLLTTAQADLPLVSMQMSDKPVRLAPTTIPATIAFKSHNALWLMDGKKAKSQPQRVTFQGTVDLVDWSADGAWFAFLRYPSEEKRSEGTLWVVRSDGNVVQQVDTAAVMGTPQWSPLHHALAYRTWNEAQNGEGPAKVARITGGGHIEVTSIIEASEQVASLAWEPNGKCLAVSLPRTTTQPLRIEELCLNGSRKRLFTDPGLAPAQPGSIFLREATGLTWSPDGRYLSYFINQSSASLSADNVPIYTLDTYTGTSRMIGNGLGYREWLAWSPDSRTLAFINGGNRMVTTNKSLMLLDTTSGQITNLAKKGFVDTAPVWSQQAPCDLFYQRGVERDWHFDPNQT